MESVDTERMGVCEDSEWIAESTDVYEGDPEAPQHLPCPALI